MVYTFVPSPITLETRYVEVEELVRYEPDEAKDNCTANIFGCPDTVKASDEALLEPTVFVVVATVADAPV